MRSQPDNSGEKRDPAADRGGFTCLRCGDCCRWPGHVWLTPEDISALAARFGQSESEWIERFTVLTRNRAGLSLRENTDGSCEFLEGGRCAVYEDRPGQCRDFPGRWSVASPCPGQEGSPGESHEIPGQ